MEVSKFDFLIIFGATGDLVIRKVIPSLYHLYKTKQITLDNFNVFAFARRDFKDGKYSLIINESLQKHFNDSTFLPEKDFYNIFNYVQGDLNDRNCFVELNNQIIELEEKLAICANKLFYLAIAPSLYDEVVIHIQETQFAKMCKGAEVKALIEKPFGLNLESSIKTDKVLLNVFKEEQIYRLDHYLGKGILRKITDIRESYKEVWNDKNIERVFISATETLGVESRGEFFDSVGSLRDVGQNHLLEILALITMENFNTDLNSLYRSSKAGILEKLVKYNSENDISKFTFRAQYKGYKDIENVNKNSTTETYFKVNAFLEDPNWKYTKFVLEAGKKCGQSRSYVEILFKNKDKLYINFSRLNPFIRYFKGPNYTELANGEHFESQYTEEYSKLLIEALNGEQKYFVDQKVVEAQWKFIDPIVQGWSQNYSPLFTYAPDDQSILSLSSL